ncbi:MAG: hypothetical protein HY391_02125 [Deltaproteobacteria bacterium]|nr:hypothetical protein [Deltaproteobacteria bacterium]
MPSLRELLARSALLSKIADPFINYYESLPYERRIQIQYGAVFAVIFIIALVMFQGYRGVGKLQQEVNGQRAFAKELLEELSQYAARQSYVETLFGRMSQVKGDFSLISYLERNAGKANISKESVERIDPKELPPGELVKISTAEVSLLKISLRQLVDFLYYIESSPYPIKVNQLRVSKRFDDPLYLDASLTIAFAAPKEAVPPPAPPPAEKAKEGAQPPATRRGGKP